LVVDTVDLSTKTFIDNYRTPHTDKLHVVERFKLSGDGKGLEDLISVEDPGLIERFMGECLDFRPAERVTSQGCR
jgi:hypothetical protein